MLNTSILGLMNGELLHWLSLVLALGAVTVWAFMRKRKKRFEKDSKIPFEE
jgi:hypothetical protein